MVECTRKLLGLFRGALVLLVLLASPLALRAEEPDPTPAAISPPAADAPQLEHFEYWQARAEAARARVAAARAELDEANAAVSRMRRRNHPRGAARIRIREERDQAQAAYDAAVQQLEAELSAAARAAGAPRHWLSARTPTGRR